ncbi:hypothetical protein YA29_16350 [Klebsiella aerogenes]|nr:hypothetical protein YA29_16350 [Klebsiella aerogenes]
MAHILKGVIMMQSDQVLTDTRHITFLAKHFARPETQVTVLDVLAISRYFPTHHRMQLLARYRYYMTAPTRQSISGIQN